MFECEWAIQKVSELLGTSPQLCCTHPIYTQDEKGIYFVGLDFENDRKLGLRVCFQRKSQLYYLPIQKKAPEKKDSITENEKKESNSLITEKLIVSWEKNQNWNIVGPLFEHMEKGIIYFFTTDKVDEHWRSDFSSF